MLFLCGAPLFYFMKTHLFIGLLTAALITGTITVRAEPQPQMHEALRLLHDAQVHPEMELLHKAKEHLEKGDRDKGGHRAEAIEAIDRAMKAHKNGEPKKAEEHILHAIHEVEEGEAWDREHEGHRR
ncbi:MAG: hypothetical protein JWO94_2226 [Verrucomicrobiaceae bacterium]|nr:hypothetical protein [Verrucomicrobiaceae bacterium]